MKINKKNPFHWLLLFYTGFLCFLFLPLRVSRYFQKDKGCIILYGHKLHGNILGLYNYYQTHPESLKKLYYLTLDKHYYLNIRHKNNILYAGNPFHILKVVMSDLIVSDHGLHSLILLQKFSSIKFADVWHGIPFKGFIPEDFTLQHKYNEIWLSSNKLKQLYVEKFGFRENQCFVTGYGRTDTLLSYYNDKAKLKREMHLAEDKKVILFAPTWQQDDKSRDEIPFGYSAQDFIDEINKTALACNAQLIIRFHLNTTLIKQLAHENILYLPLATHPDSEKILAVSDVLITDWSSTAFDMMVINKPIIFIDSPPPFKNGFSLPPSYRCGDVITSMENLKKSLSEAITQEDQYMAGHQPHYGQVKVEVYDDTLDGNSAARYQQRIETLLHIQN